MEYSELENFNSTLNLSSRFEDILMVFLIPAFSIFLIPLKLVSIVILRLIIKRKKEIKHKASQFYYLVTNETCDLAETAILCLAASLRCGSYCSFGYDYLTKILDLIFLIYGIPVMIQIKIFMEISFTIDRIKALKLTNTQIRNGMKFRYKLAISLAVSLVVAVPNYLMPEIIQSVGILVTTNQTLYVISSRPVFQAYYWSIGLSIFNIIRALGPILLLFILNIKLIHEFNQKNKITKEENSSTPEHQNSAEFKAKINELKISKLVTAINVSYLVGYFPYSISIILFLYFGSTSSIYIYYFALSRFLLIFCNYSYIFIFYKLSPSFKKSLLNTLKNL